MLIYKYYHDHHSSAAADDRTIFYILVISSAHRTTTTFPHEFSPNVNRLGVWLHVDSVVLVPLSCTVIFTILLLLLYYIGIRYARIAKTCLQQFSSRRRVDISCGVHVRSLLRFVVTTDQHPHRHRWYYALGLLGYTRWLLKYNRSILQVLPVPIGNLFIYRS